MNQEIHRRSHLTKEQRLPKSYKEVEKILNKVKKCEANVKTVLNSSKLRGAVLHKVSGLTFNVLKQRRILDSIIEKTKILEKEPYLRKELAGILIHELLFGKGFPGKSKPEETVLKYQVEIEKTYNDLKSDDSLFSSLISIPKYVRVNTLVITLQEVLEDLEYLGVRQIIFDSNISEDKFYDLVKNLEKNTFMLDFHFKDLLIFHGEENLTTWSLYKKGHVFIQDKSSYIPAYVLAPPPGATVIDACAAPGMKTLHLTALMENDGIIYACERDQHRFEILNNMLKSGHANICKTFCGDFNSVDPKDEKYSSVEYILLDPSCSGSGMVSRMDSITDTKESKNDLRIKKLAGFQIILLKHALLFPSVKRVVYSTCSITETENEFVVHEVLNHFSHRFRLSPVLPNWTIRGSNDFEFGSHCLRAYPDKCLTNGFFVAMFERLEDSGEQHYPEKKQHKFKKEKYKSEAKRKDSEFDYGNESFDNDYNISNQLEKEEIKNNVSQDNIYNEAAEEKPLKKKHKKLPLDDGDDDHNNNFQLSAEETMPHKKKYNRQPIQIQEQTNIEGTVLTEVESIHKSKKKHKRKHEKEECHNNFSEKQISELNVPQSNVEDNISQSEITHKSKRKHEKKECYNNLCEKQTPDLNVHQYGIESNISTESLQVETPHKAKKKHKRKHEKEDTNNSFSEDTHKAKKKHKRKHEEEDTNNSLGETQTSELQLHYETQTSDLNVHRCGIENNISTDSLQIETPHKAKKKHKRKHEKEDTNNSFGETQTYELHCEKQTPDLNVHQYDIESNISTESAHKAKKKHKRKHEKEDTNNNFGGKQTPDANVHQCDIENNISTQSLQVETPHKAKEKHKREHEKEDNSFGEAQTSEVQLLHSTFEEITLKNSQQDVENFYEKKKKHKKKHEKRDCDSSSSEVVVKTHNSDVGIEHEGKASHKKKKRKDTQN